MTYSAAPMPESAAKPKMPILLLSVLILALLMPVLRLVEYGSMASMVNSLIEALRQSFGERIYQKVIDKPSFHKYQDIQVDLVIRSVFGIFFSVIYIVLGIFVFLGRNWARIVLTVFAVLNTLLVLLFLLDLSIDYNKFSDSYSADLVDFRGQFFRLIIIYIAILVAGLLPVILMWMPPVNVYMRNTKAYWKAKKALEAGSKSYADRFAAQTELASKEQAKGTNS